MTLILSCVPLDTVLEGAEGLEGARCGVESGESVPDLDILFEAQQDLLELLLVEFARVLAHLDQHLDGGTDLSLFDDFALTLQSNFLHE